MSQFTDKMPVILVKEQRLFFIRHQDIIRQQTDMSPLSYQHTVIRLECYITNTSKKINGCRLPKASATGMVSSDPDFRSSADEQAASNRPAIHPAHNISFFITPFILHHPIRNPVPPSALPQIKQRKQIEDQLPQRSSKVQIFFIIQLVLLILQPNIYDNQHINYYSEIESWN